MLEKDFIKPLRLCFYRAFALKIPRITLTKP